MAMEIRRTISGPNDTPAHDAPILCVAYNPARREIFTGSQDTTIKAWQSETGELLHRAIVWQDRRTAEFCVIDPADAGTHGGDGIMRGRIPYAELERMQPVEMDVEMLETYVVTRGREKRE